MQCEDLQGRGRTLRVRQGEQEHQGHPRPEPVGGQAAQAARAPRLRRGGALLPTLLNVFYYREPLFIVYELLRDDLYHIYKYIKECHLPKYFTTERLREVARQCVQTLAVLHAREVIHCDLKPENILISSLTSCQVKVIDYGNAYLHHDQRCSYVQSRAYRAPEVVLGLPYSPKVDLWSLGCILMELFTNRLLFDNRSVQSLLASHIALLGPMPMRLIKRGRSPSTTSRRATRSRRSSASTRAASAGCTRRRRRSRRCASATAAPTPTLPTLSARCSPSTRTSASPPRRRSSTPLSSSRARRARPTPSARRTRRARRASGCSKSTNRSRTSSRPRARSRASARLATAWRRTMTLADDVPGPATPTSFREQCYLDRERLEKKRSRKSGVGRWTSSGSQQDRTGNMDAMMISPNAPARAPTQSSTADGASVGRGWARHGATEGRMEPGARSAREAMNRLCISIWVLTSVAWADVWRRGEAAVPEMVCARRVTGCGPRVRHSIR